MNTPKPGFYYHFKHDPTQGVNHHAYHVLGVAKDTEEECETEYQYEVIYTPLYDLSGFLGEEIQYCKRPLEMFIGTKDQDGEEIQRFQRITDEEVLVDLRKYQK